MTAYPQVLKCRRMTKLEKKLVLNTIHNRISHLERNLPKLKAHRDWGLQKGKLGNIPYIAEDLRELADALEIYAGPDFTLDDMQDYAG